MTPAIGSILEVVTKIGSHRYAEVTPTGLVDVDRLPLGQLSDCRSWRYVTDEERSEWNICRDEVDAKLMTSELSDIAATRGAVALSRLLEACHLGTSEELLHVADELRARGLPGRASQVEAMRAAKATRRATLFGIPLPALLPSQGTDRLVDGSYSFVVADRRAS